MDDELLAPPQAGTEVAPLNAEPPAIDHPDPDPPTSAKPRRARRVPSDATVAELVAALVEAGLMEPAEDDA